MKRAARNTEAADFDGVEIHAANGYLIDQSKVNTNTRSDAYGGAIQDRVRLLFEIVEALIPILGADRIGVRPSSLGKMKISATTIRNRLLDKLPSAVPTLDWPICTSSMQRSNRCSAERSPSLALSTWFA
jgi:2,4-dienoyl-CoA reductase-like NADH-dependent reductase (Old Yellow Enzyme family)